MLKFSRTFAQVAAVTDFTHAIPLKLLFVIIIIIAYMLVTQQDSSVNKDQV